MGLGVLARASKARPTLAATRQSRTKKGIAVVTATLLAAGGSVLAASSAAEAAPTSVSVGQGQFLGGTVGGADLASLVSLENAIARNSGGATDTEAHPLSATALDALTVDLGNGVDLLGDDGVLRLGAVNQFAQASPNGSSSAASGAVTNTGGVALGGSDAPQSTATFDLSQLIGSDLAGALANLKVDVGALGSVASQAAGTSGAQSGDYGIAGLSLQLDSPALANTVSGLDTTLTSLQPRVDGLQQTLDAALGGTVTIRGLPDLSTLTPSLTTVTSADGSITANLQTGAITIDVAKVLASAGLDLNDLPANTQLLPYITNALTTQLLPAVASALDGLSAEATASLDGLTVTLLGLPVSASVLASAVDPVIADVTAPISTAVAGLGDTVVTPLATALTDVVSLQANVQSTSGGAFTERALRVGLLPATDTATVDLASATVGPNAGPAAVVAPTTTSLTPDHGPVAGGTSVTVAGSGFTSDATVSVDGGAAITPTAVAPDGTSLTFDTPAHAAGPVGVVVATGAGDSAPQTFTYDAPAPTTTGIDPASGPDAGGTVVTLTGTGFAPDATVSVDGGAAITPTAVAGDGTSLTFTTPAHAAGPAAVTVSTAAGTSGPQTFDYVATPPTPTITALSPDHGTVDGGTVVTATGAGFTPDTTIAVDGTAVTPTVASATSLTFTTPAHAAGPVDVTATTDGVVSAPIAYTYDPTATAPTLTALTPDHGPAAGGTSVTVTGTGFTPASTVSVGGGAPVLPDSVAADGDSLTFTTPAHAAGSVDVTVTSNLGTSGPLPFAYDAPTPTITGLTPGVGPVAGGTTVTVDGTGFTPDASVSVDGGAAIAPASVSDDGTSLTFVTPAHVAGPVDVVVTTAGGASAPATFDYVPAAPTITALTPDAGPTTGGGAVTVTGTGFDAGSTVSVDGGPAIVPTTIASDGTSLTYTAPAHPAGAVDVTVSSPTGTSDPATFTYQTPALAAPTETSLTPGHGAVIGGTVVTIVGTGFTPTTTVSVDGSDPIAPSSVSTDGTTLTFTTPAHASGDVSVTTTNAAGTSSPRTFTYDPDLTPTITAVSPDHGTTAGGTTVTITGTGFTPDSTVSVGGSAPIAPTAVSTDGTTITFTTPAHAAGPVAVTVTDRNGTATGGTFTYAAPAAGSPTVHALSPDHGPVAGGTVVTITGAGFTSASTVSVDGSAAITPSAVSSDGTSLTFTTPAHAAGPVDVTVTNAAGTSAPGTFTYEQPSTAVPAPVITSPAPGQTVGGSDPVITGTGQPGDTVTVTIDGRTVCTATVAANGTWSCRPTAPLPSGSWTITATEVGPDGVSEPSDPVTFMVEPALGLGGGSGTGAANGSGVSTGSGVGDGAAVAPGSLAFTGSDAGPALALALVLLVAGIAVTAVRRTRRGGRR